MGFAYLNIYNQVVRQMQCLGVRVLGNGDVWLIYRTIDFGRSLTSGYRSYTEANLLAILSWASENRYFETFCSLRFCQAILYFLKIDATNQIVMWCHMPFRDVNSSLRVFRLCVGVWLAHHSPSAPHPQFPQPLSTQSHGAQGKERVERLS